MLLTYLYPRRQHEATQGSGGAPRIKIADGPVLLSRNETINKIHNKLQAFLKLLEFRIIGSAGGAPRIKITDGPVLREIWLRVCAREEMDGT
jgi:hypothetical protein